MIIVSDTSPIRALHHLNLVELLKNLFNDVIVPPAVAEELRKPRRKLPTIDIASFAFIKCLTPTDHPAVQQLMTILDAGESQAIALAIELSPSTLLIDEAGGRREAIRRKVNIVGTLGVLREAKLRGHVVAVRPLIDALVHGQGFFLHPSLRETILRDCGESP